MLTVKNIYNNTLILIPAYNEERTIGDLISALNRVGFNTILVVNDGSADKTSEIAKGLGAVVVTHPINMGAGSALRTGFAYAKASNFEFVLTCDADGQHTAEDVLKVATATTQFDFVNGQRDFSTPGVPFSKKITSLPSDLLTAFLCGRFVKDSLSGLRRIRVSKLQELSLTAYGYAIVLETVIECVKKGLSVSYVVVPARYTDYSTTKKTRLKVSGLYKVLNETLNT